MNMNHQRTCKRLEYLFLRVVSCLFIFMFCFAMPALAQNTNLQKTLIIKDHMPAENIAGYMNEVGLGQGWGSISDVMAQGAALQVTPSTGDDPRLTIMPSKQAKWFVMRVRNNSSNASWLLDFGSTFEGRAGIISDITVYVQSTNPYVVDQANDSLLSMPVLQNNQQKNYVMLNLPIQQNVLIYFKIMPSHLLPSVIPIQIVSEKNYVEILSGRYELNSLFLSAICAVAFYFLAYAAIKVSYAWLSFSGYFFVLLMMAICQTSFMYGRESNAHWLISMGFPMLSILSVFMTKTCLETTNGPTRDHGFYYGLFILAGLGAVASFILPAEIPILRSFLTLGPCMAVFALLAVYSGLKFEKDSPHFMALSLGWMAALMGCTLSALWLDGTLAFDTMYKNAFWYSAILQGFLFVVASLLKDSGHVTATQAEGQTASLDVDALIKLRQTKESAEHSRLLRVIEKERELLTQFRQREAQRSEEMSRAKEIADTANKAKSAFLAVVSHEIRTPMTGIMGMVRLLLESKLSKEQKDYATTIQESGDSMLTLLNDILDFEKIERGKMELERIPFDLPRLVQSISTLMSGHAAIKNIELRTMIDPEVSQFVIGDPSRLRQVLLNLVGNAIKFTAQGEVTIKIHRHMRDPKENTHRLHDDIEEIYFAVKDSGIGISAEAQENIFTPFSQADSSISRKFGGTGLGLAICKGLIEAMGSKIHISSREGEGSMFFFILPMHKTTMEQAVHIASPHRVIPARPISRRSLHVLVVDDNAVNQKVISSFLARLNHTCDQAETAEIALSMVQKKIYDVILMDIQLPGMSGDEATRILRKLPDPDRANLPVIALTGNVRDEDVLIYTKAGMNGHVSKPIEPDKLRDAIDAAMHDVEIAEEEEDSFMIPPSAAADTLSPSNLKINSDAFDDDMLGTLKSNLGADKLNELLGELMDKTHELVAALEESREKGDQTAIKARAHELKGMAGNFGLKEISRMAADIEQKAMQAEWPSTTADIISHLPDAAVRAQESLNQWMRV